MSGNDQLTKPEQQLWHWLDKPLWWAAQDGATYPQIIAALRRKAAALEQSEAAGLPVTLAVSPIR